MLKRIATRGFRNLEDGSWAPEKPFQLLLGINGAGKTSLLEAIYVAATTRSFRTSRLEECARDRARGFGLEVEVESGRRARLSYSWSGSGARRAVNDSVSTLAEHLEVLPTIAWTTASSQVFQGPPEERRKLLDQGVVARRPAALIELANYRRALAQKRGVLSGSPGVLEPWNELLAATAAELIAARADFVVELDRAVQTIVEREDLPYRGLELEYRPSPPDGGRSADQVLETLRRAESEERRLGRPLVGPHRDELVLRWQGRDLRRMVSAGERKGIGLALTAARGEVLATSGRAPLYLLDDLDAELDTRHLAVVLRAFSRARQIFATSSRPEVWEAILESARGDDSRAAPEVFRNRLEDGSICSW